MTKFALIIVALLLLAFPAVAQEDAVPRFEPSDCPFEADATIECGFVVVPEFHNQPDGDTIRLSVVIRRGTDSSADPVMLLSGGPGEKTTASANFLVNGNFTALAGAERDFIIFDQRGVGLSEPALDCPEFTDTILEWLELEPDADAAAQANFDSLVACRDRLVSEGNDLSAYNTLENAADVADIVTALGYEQVNLVGVSYGSLLAQAVMRDYPAIIRSVIIDSVLPRDRSFFIDSFGTVSEALNRLIAACEAEVECSAAYPNLQQVLFDVIDELNANPVPISIVNPTTGETYDSYLTGDAILTNLSVFLYQAAVLPLLPQAIFNVSEGDYALMTQLSGAVIPAYSALSRGMLYSVFCADDLVGRTPEELLQAYEAQPPQYQGQADIEVAIETTAFALCEAWDVPTLDESVKAPLESDIATLVMGGEYDPVTPFIYAEAVAANLENSYLYEFPAIGHSVINSSECALTIATAFIADPTTEPDASCIAEMPPVAFALPVGDGELTFEPYTNEAMGISGIVPVGWQEFGPGIYGVSQVSNTVLLQQAFEGTVQDALDLLTQQLGGAPTETDTITAGEFEWTLYQTSVQGLNIDVALANEGSKVMLVLLQTLPADRDQLFEDVLLPVLEAIQPM